MSNNRLKKPFGGIVLDSSFRIIIPFTLVYGLYILTHGEFSPGGGFQAGALLAVGIVLVRLIQGADKESFNVPGYMAIVCAGTGTFIYAATGWLTLFGGGQFLDYTFLPVPMHDWSELHALGILMIEIGVTVCVMMTIIDIMDAIIERLDDDEEVDYHE
jgi:multicomponent Na+:H+ antiporter subunit B